MERIRFWLSAKSNHVIPEAEGYPGSEIFSSSIYLLMKDYFLYILANRKNGVLYTGVTNDLMRRIYEHKNELIDGFTKKYRIKNLVYYEMISDIANAIAAEKRIKKWHRRWKDDTLR